MLNWNKLGYVIVKGSTGILHEKTLYFSSDQVFYNKNLADSLLMRNKNMSFKLFVKQNEYDLLSKDKLIIFLIRNNFEYIQTVSNVWKDSFKLTYSKDDDKNLFVLFRKNGIDIKFFNGENGSFEIDKFKKKYKFSSGLKKNYNYIDESQSIIYQVLQLILIFKSSGWVNI